MAQRFDSSWPTISRHLSVLRDAGLVTTERNGHVSSYRAAKPPWPGYGPELMIAAVAIFLMVFGLERWARGRGPSA